MMFLPFDPVVVAKDGDVDLREMADRHYSRRSVGSALFVGPGEKIVLTSPRKNWVFCWRRARYRKDAQVGWECTLFRNESPELSSKIIAACEAFVVGRKFTYVNPAKIRSRNPGYCFLCAGWKKVATTQAGLILLAKDPALMGME